MYLMKFWISHHGFAAGGIFSNLFLLIWLDTHIFCWKMSCSLLPFDRLHTLLIHPSWMVRLTVFSSQFFRFALSIKFNFGWTFSSKIQHLWTINEPSIWVHYLFCYWLTSFLGIAETLSKWYSYCLRKKKTARRPQKQGALFAQKKLKQAKYFHGRSGCPMGGCFISSLGSGTIVDQPIVFFVDEVLKVLNLGYQHTVMMFDFKKSRFLWFN